MADVQPENGYTRIANEILENLAKVKLSPTQYRIVFVIWRFTYGFKRKSHNISLTFLSEATGCDKRQIQRELKSLADRHIVHQEVKKGKSRHLGFNKNHDEWVGKTTIGETTIGEIDNGESVNGGGGETDNTTIGETVKGAIGEIDNQEINLKETSKETLKENHHDDESNKPNPFVEYEKHFGFYSPAFKDQINDWIDNSNFKEPEAVICETIKRAKLQTPKNPTKYINKILNNLHNLDLFTLEAVKEYNQKFDRSAKQQKSFYEPTKLAKTRPAFMETPKPPTEEELKEVEAIEAELPF